MGSLKLVGLAVILAVGGGATGYALAARPPRSAPVSEPATECAVPAPVPVAAVVPERLAETAHEEARHEEPRHDEDGGREEPSIGGPVRARRLVVTHAIEEHEPVDELAVVEGLAHGERVYAFVDLANPGEATEVEVTFRHESGLTVGRVTLDVPAHASRYRTWAYSSHVEEPGNWTALVRDASGHTVAAHSFEVR